MDDLYLVLEQKQEGCDYTIGCGMEAIKLEATTPTEALLQGEAILTERYMPSGPKYGVSDHYGADGESELHTAQVMRLVGSIDPQALFLHLKAKDIAIEEMTHKDERRVEYEKLKKEFEK